MGAPDLKIFPRLTEEANFPAFGSGGDSHTAFDCGVFLHTAGASSGSKLMRKRLPVAGCRLACNGPMELVLDGLENVSLISALGSLGSVTK